MHSTYETSGNSRTVEHLHVSTPDACNLDSQVYCVVNQDHQPRTIVLLSMLLVDQPKSQNPAIRIDGMYIQTHRFAHWSWCVFSTSLVQQQAFSKFLQTGHDDYQDNVPSAGVLPVAPAFWMSKTTVVWHPISCSSCPVFGHSHPFSKFQASQSSFFHRCQVHLRFLAYLVRQFQCMLG